jgi:Icc-related predicted phosphoesterase
MRLVALSDVHGAGARLHVILGRETGYDAVVVAGDLTTMGTPADAEALLAILRTFGVPVFVVAGNMDPPELEGVLSAGARSVNGRGEVFGTIGICGCSAAPLSPLHTPYELPESEIAARCERGFAEIAGAARRVFVPHAPPFNTTVDVVRSGRHVGSTAVRAAIECHAPDVVLCGHIHEARGTDRLGKSVIVNCGPAHEGSYATITLDDEVSVELHP